MVVCLWPLAFGRCARQVSAAAGLVWTQKPKAVHNGRPLTKLLTVTSLGGASSDKSLGAVGTAAAHERQMGLAGRAENQTNFICSTWQNTVDSRPN